MGSTRKYWLVAFAGCLVESTTELRMKLERSAAK